MLLFVFVSTLHGLNESGFFIEQSRVMDLLSGCSYCATLYMCKLNRFIVFSIAKASPPHRIFFLFLWIELQNLKIFPVYYLRDLNAFLFLLH